MELEPIPDVEWWDARILSSGAYQEPSEQSSGAASGGSEWGLNRERITAYVEHPVELEPPAEGEAPPPRPLMLTKKVPVLPLPLRAEAAATARSAHPRSK